MSSHVSLTTRDGGGRLASGAEHIVSQRPTIAPTASSGGNAASAYRFAAASSRDGPASGRGAGLRASLAAAAAAGTLSATTLASWVRGTDLKVALIASARALDREAREICLGIRRVEHLAVEERLDTTRRRLRYLTGGHPDLVRRLAPQILAVDLG